MKPDIEKAINMAVSTGKVRTGYESVLKSVLNGKVKATILSNNLPTKVEKELIRNCELSEIPIIQYNKSGKDLGAVCGRPHKVSTLAVLDPGNSKILEYID